MGYLLAIQSPSGDMARKRFSAENYFQTMFAFYSTAMLNNILRRHQQKAIKYLCVMDFKIEIVECASKRSSKLSKRSCRVNLK